MTSSSLLNNTRFLLLNEQVFLFYEEVSYE